MRETMEGDPPVALWLFDKSYARKGLIPAPEAVEGTFLWNGHGSLVFTVPGDNPRISPLTTPGARVVCTLNRPGYTEPKVLISGPVTEFAGQSFHHLPTRVFTVADDFGIFDEIIAWPNPASAISSQTTNTHDERTGPAETVVRGYVTANAPRDGVAVTSAASAGLGPSLTVRMRMNPLADRLFPAVSDLGLGVRVVQQPDESVRRLITWLPVTHTRVITEESGVILPGAEMNVRAPTRTRVVVGVGGEGTARKFYQFIDTAAETKWGVSRSMFVDARDIPSTDLAVATKAQERGTEALAEAAETTSLKVELTETDAWQFGTAFELGDKIPIRLTGEDAVTERVSEVGLSWATGSGLEITPRVGGFEESPDDRLYKLVARALKANRNLEASR